MDIPVERDDGIMALSGIIGRVKHLPRTGWLRSGIVDCESVASHMYRMAVLAFMLNDGSVDRDKCIRMALVHDLAESIVGDITPYCGISDTTKHERELQAMTKIAQLTPNAMVGNEMLALWQEYEQGVTPEARAVKQLDKFDMIAQAFEYERDRGTHGLQEFFDSTANSAAINSEPFLSWNKELLAQRTALQQQQQGSNDNK